MFDAGPVIELYPDVRRTLSRLRRAGLRLSVVSDNWAGLEATFDGLGIDPALVARPANWGTTVSPSTARPRIPRTG